MRRTFKEMLQELEIDLDFTLHSVQHSFTINVLNGWADLCYVQEILAHEKFESIQIYWAMAA